MKDKHAPAFFRCYLPTDPASAVVIQHLREEGLLCADHRLRRGDRELVVLRQSEIALLEDSGIEVKILRKLVRQAPRRGDGPRARTIATGFVSDYLDSVGIDAAYANLNALFPALASQDFLRRCRKLRWCPNFKSLR